MKKIREIMTEKSWLSIFRKIQFGQIFDIGSMGVFEASLEEQLEEAFSTALNVTKCITRYLTLQGRN